MNPTPWKFDLRRKRFICVLVGTFSICFTCYKYLDFLCNFVGYYISAYKTLKIIDSPTLDDHKKWSIYWVLYASFNLLEYLVPNIYLRYFFCLGKWCFLVWLLTLEKMDTIELLYSKIVDLFLHGCLSTSIDHDFYNPVAGRSEFQENEKLDKYGNPVSRENDLGKDGAFVGYNILIGQFYTSAAIAKPIEALEFKGFFVDNVKDEEKFLSKLQSGKYHIAWVISSRWIECDDFISTLKHFHSDGGSIFLFADNVPYVAHASAFLEAKFGTILTGDYPANQTLSYKRNGHLTLGHFGQHQIFTGIRNLFEGVTICHPVYSESSTQRMTTIATATDGNSCIDIYDPLSNSTEGRLCLDCGFTKLFINWDTAGTARFIVNANCWLARPRNKFDREKTSLNFLK